MMNSKKALKGLIVLSASIVTLCAIGTVELKNIDDNAAFVETDKMDVAGFTNPVVHIKKNADAVAPTTDKIGAQISSISENGTVSLRFVIATLSEESTYTIKRGMYKDYFAGNGHDEKLNVASTDTFTCTHRYSAISNGGTVTTAESLGYKAYFVYTMKNIPSAYWFSYLNVTSEDGKTSVDANVAGILQTTKSYYNRFNFVDNTVKAKSKTADTYYIPSHKPVKVNNFIVKKGEQITRVEDFSNCTKATAISVPNTINTITKDAFKGSSSLTSINFENKNGWSQDVSDKSANAASFKTGHNLLETNAPAFDYSLNNSVWQWAPSIKQLSHLVQYNNKYASTTTPILLREGDSITFKGSNDGTANPYTIEYALSNSELQDGQYYVDGGTVAAGSTFTYTHTKTSSVPHNYIYIVFNAYIGNKTTAIDNVSDVKNYIEITRTHEHYDYVDISTYNVPVNDKAFYNESFTTTMKGVKEENLVVSMSGATLTEGYTYSYSSGVGTLTINKVNGPLSIEQNSNVANVSFDDVDCAANDLFAVKGQPYVATDIDVTPEDLYVLQGTGPKCVTLTNGVDYTYSFDESTSKGTLTINSVSNDIRVCSRTVNYLKGRNFSFDDNLARVTKYNANRATNTAPRKIAENEILKLKMSSNFTYGLTISKVNENGLIARLKDLGWFAIGAGKTLADSNAVSKVQYAAANMQDVSTAAGNEISFSYEALCKIGAFEVGDEIYVTLTTKMTPEKAITDANIAEFESSTTITTKDLATYTVTVDGNSFDDVYEFNTLTLNDLTINENFIKVQMGDRTLVKGEDYTYVDGRLTVPYVTGNIVVSNTQQSFTVTYDAVSYGTNSLVAYEGETYTASGLSIDTSVVKIFMGGVELIEGTTYTYSEGTLTIPNVTGDIVISASMVSVAYSGIDSGSNPLVADVNGNYIATGLTVDESRLEVYMGNSKLESTEYTYVDGTLTVPNVVGSLWISEGFSFETGKVWTFGGTGNVSVSKFSQGGRAAIDKVRRISQTDYLNLKMINNRPYYLSIGTLNANGVSITRKIDLGWIGNTKGDLNSNFKDLEGTKTTVGKTISFSYGQLCDIGLFDYGTEIYIALSISFGGVSSYVFTEQDIQTCAESVSITPFSLM